MYTYTLYRALNFRDWKRLTSVGYFYPIRTVSRCYAAWKNLSPFWWPGIRGIEALYSGIKSKNRPGKQLVHFSQGKYFSSKSKNVLQNNYCYNYYYSKTKQLKNKTITTTMTRRSSHDRYFCTILLLAIGLLHKRMMLYTSIVLFLSK